MTFLHTGNSEIALALAYIVLICPCPTICPSVKKIKNGGIRCLTKTSMGPM